MSNSTRRFLMTCLAVLLISTVTARADDRTIARAPLPPPLPTPPAEAQSGPQAGEPAVRPSIRFDDDSAVQPSQESRRPIAPARPGAGQAAAASDALAPKQPVQDKPGHGAASHKKEARAVRSEHQSPPAGTDRDVTAAAPPHQLSPPSPEYDVHRALPREPEPADIASADRETTARGNEDLPTAGIGSIPYPSYRPQFGWPYGSPQAGGFPSYPAYPPYRPGPPYRAESYSPQYPPPPYFPNTTPYRYP